MKRKVLALLLSASTLLSTTACSSQNAPSSQAPSSSQSVSQSEPASSESWSPTQDVECIVPFAAGGGSDLLTRKIIEYANMGVNMVAVNVEGGGGLVGAQQAAAAEADGYTILAHNPMNLIAQGLTGNSNVWQELAPLAFVVDDWTILVTNKASGWANIDDFSAYAKEHPGEVKWGLTSAPVTVADSYRAMKGLEIDCTLVPYDGGAETISALMGNHTQVMLATASECSAYLESGDFIPLFVIGSVKCPVLPDTPLLTELGVDVDTGAPRAYFAPVGCSDEIVAYYDQLLQKICEDQKFVDDLAAMGFTVSYTGSKDGKELMQKWYDGLQPVFQEYGLAG
ncbi:MAG: tripartite tricarboxylate transporter substrate binding protein [Anaerotruncus sp.]|nr:tripartite tricarboxylate transporter substrate binding protein [Anaerotruncus sp.]